MRRNIVKTRKKVKKGAAPPCPDLGQEESQKVWSTLMTTLVGTLVPTVLIQSGKINVCAELWDFFVVTISHWCTNHLPRKTSMKKSQKRHFPKCWIRMGRVVNII